MNFSEESTRSPTMGLELNQSSPQAVVDCQSLTNCMNKNKQSLKVKLQLRRPINVLVDQGILPPPNESANFFEQKHKLERAKTGDFLKNRIQRRPLRDELVQQNILEDVFDPHSYEEQRKKKKARLADDLNEKLSHRPGPLELIKTNILHTDETLEQAIKGGQIEFKKTSEGEILKNLPPRFVFEEESCSSDSSPSPPILLHANQILQRAQIQPSPLIASTIPTTFGTNQFIIKYPDQTQQQQQPKPQQLQQQPTLTSTQLSTNSTLQNVPLNTFILTAPPQQNVQILHNAQVAALQQSQQQQQQQQQSLQSSNFKIQSSQIQQTVPTVNKPKKKNKNKNQPKTRVIKFHEYTGPPNAKKQSSLNMLNSETSYELLLKQQQLFLQWQLESQQIAQNEQIEMNTEQDTRPSFVKEDSPMSVVSSIGSPQQMQTATVAHVIPQLIKEERFSVQSPSIIQAESIKPSVPSLQAKQVPLKKIVGKLEDMKVSDLKAELKKRNLPVSGAKKQLIERLQPFTDSVMSMEQFTASNGAEMGKFSQRFIVNDSKSQETTTNSNNYVFIPNQTTDGSFPTLAIPMSTFIPQYQIVSNQASQQILLQSQPHNIIRAAQQPNIIQAQLHQSTKTIGIAGNQPIIQQLILYPNTTTVATTANTQQQQDSSQQKMARSNSLPSSSLHQLQRNSSMPLVNPTVVDKPTNQQQKTLPMAIAEAEKQNCEVKKIFVTFDGEVVVDESNQIIKFGDMKTTPAPTTNTTTTTTNKKKDSAKKKTSKAKQTPLPVQTQPKPVVEIPAVTNIQPPQIQPDSTTNSNSLDLDFILDLEEFQKMGESLEAEDRANQKNGQTDLMFHDSSWIEDMSFMESDALKTTGDLIQTEQQQQHQQQQQMMQTQIPHLQNQNSSQNAIEHAPISQQSQFQVQQFEPQNQQFQQQQPMQTEISVESISNPINNFFTDSQIQFTNNGNFNNNNNNGQFVSNIQQQSQPQNAMKNQPQFPMMNNSVSSQCHYAANSNFNTRVAPFDAPNPDMFCDFFSDDFDFRSSIILDS